MSEKAGDRKGGSLIQAVYAIANLSKNCEILLKRHSEFLHPVLFANHEIVHFLLA